MEEEEGGKREGEIIKKRKGKERKSDNRLTSC